jgi:hypothetical protein
MERIETMADTLALWNKQDKELTAEKLKAMTPEDCDQVLIKFIRQYANDRYEQGWSAVVESFLDGDILEYLSDADYVLPKALKAIQEWVDIRKEMEDNCRF